MLSKSTEKSVKPEGNLRLCRWPKQPLRRDLVFVTSTTDGVFLHDRQYAYLQFHPQARYRLGSGVQVPVVLRDILPA